MDVLIQDHGQIRILSNLILKHQIRFLLAILLFCIGGCSVTYEQAMNDIEASRPCCKDISQFNYSPLNLGQKNVFRIDKDSPTFIFKSGKSPFKAFRLPEISVPYTILVRSYPDGPRIDKFTIFHPVIMLLDKNFSEIESIGDGAFNLHEKTVLGIQSSLTLDGKILIDNPSYMYLVVLTSDELLSKSSYYYKVQPEALAISQALTLGSSIEGRLAVKHSPFGKISITIEPHDQIIP